MGAIAFGIGTSEVEMVLATQCILQTKPKTMRITVEGRLAPAVTAKDLALYIIAQIGTGGATGHFIEYAGPAIQALSMEARLTLCNLSIESGARGGMIAPDETTFTYLAACPSAPKGNDWFQALARWRTLKSDENARFDREITFHANNIQPMISYGTNPAMSLPVNGIIPPINQIDPAAQPAFQRALEYMNFHSGDAMLGKPVDYVFLGSCTNGRIEDFRAFTHYIKGKKKAPNVVAWLVPGSWAVDRQIREEGLDQILTAADFEIRQPGCSACLAMNDDKIPAGRYAVSTSNRNFEGRQGPLARTLLASPLTAAAAAIFGQITDPRDAITV
jgi:3-isopropylmalate/(R)-2-methylmalate dehydratase large subunit